MQWMQHQEKTPLIGETASVGSGSRVFVPPSTPITAPLIPTSPPPHPQTEWEERRKKGLCFHCQLFGPAHKCPEGRLRVLILGDDETMNDEGTTFQMEDLECLEVLPEENIPTGECSVLLSSNVTTTPSAGGKMLKLVGEILDIPLVLLVDSGATNNFISKQFVVSFGLLSVGSMPSNATQRMLSEGVVLVIM
ncbi:hypothetical protein OROHE_014512 [Orobanche hederae]